MMKVDPNMDMAEVNLGAMAMALCFVGVSIFNLQHILLSPLAVSKE